MPEIKEPIFWLAWKVKGTNFLIGLKSFYKTQVNLLKIKFLSQNELQ